MASCDNKLHFHLLGYSTRNAEIEAAIDDGIAAKLGDGHVLEDIQTAKRDTEGNDDEHDVL
mgnify:CR=1 FL=1